MNSKQKGARGEREWRDELREQGFAARRGQQFAGGADSPDVICEELNAFHFEVKRVEQLRLRDAIAQAEGDAAGKPWIVAHKFNHGPWLTLMKAETFFALLRGDINTVQNEEVQCGSSNGSVKKHNDAA